MPKAKYTINANGRASDLQRVKDDYVPVGDEQIIDLAGETLPDINTLHDPAYLKKKAKAKVKAKARALFETRFPDFKVLRYIGQKEAGIATTMTPAEFGTFEQARQAIRDISNQIEADIDSKTKEELLSFDIDNHPAWPA